MVGEVPPQDCVEGPIQPAPPQDCVGLLQVLLWVPPEQALQADQPPFTGLLTLLQKEEGVPGLTQESAVQTLPSLHCESELQATLAQDEPFPPQTPQASKVFPELGTPSQPAQEEPLPPQTPQASGAKHEPEVPQELGAVHPAQACVLQLWLDGPVQAAPPLAGEGLSQVLVWVPPPQETEQLLQADQPPFTTTGQAGALPVQVPPQLAPTHVALLPQPLQLPVTGVQTLQLGAAPEQVLLPQELFPPQTALPLTQLQEALTGVHEGAQVEPFPPHTPQASTVLPEFGTPSQPAQVDPLPPQTPQASLLGPEQALKLPSSWQVWEPGQPELSVQLETSWGPTPGAHST